MGSGEGPRAGGRSVNRAAAVQRWVYPVALAILLVGFAVALVTACL